MKLYLDDERFPKETSYLVVRSVEEAKRIMLLHHREVIEISFDHDLGENVPTGFDFAKWLVEIDLDSNSNFLSKKFTFNVHSANPLDAVNINGLLKGYLARRQYTELEVVEQRLNHLAEWSQNVEGSEKWSVWLAKMADDSVLLLPSTYRVLFESNNPPTGRIDNIKILANLGPLLPHNPLDQMNPVECLRRVGASVVTGNFKDYDGKIHDIECLAFAGENGTNRVIIHEWPSLPTYVHYMEAVLRIHNEIINCPECGGSRPDEPGCPDCKDYHKAWERAMNPNQERR